jgi:hypothetical protein
VAGGHVPILDVREVALLNLKTGREDVRPRPEPVAVLAAVGAKIELETEDSGLRRDPPVLLDEVNGCLPCPRRVPALEGLDDRFDGVDRRRYFVSGNRRSMSFW